ncbi:MAG: AAA family ATPase, partial [Kiritimatiellae bacterium]|nr:AAA family ATPase [Kiritimatiellia bacterium]
MAYKLTSEDVDELFEASNRQIRDESSVFHRYLMDEIDWRDRLICIKGPRGVGKTTLMRQHVKEAFGEDSPKAVYVSLDDLWFARHGVKDLVSYLYEHGFTHVFLDEAHHLGREWSLQIKNLADQFRKINIVYSGSSLLQLEKAQGDLSR